MPYCRLFMRLNLASRLDTAREVSVWRVVGAQKRFTLPGPNPDGGDRQEAADCVEKVDTARRAVN